MATGTVKEQLTLAEDRLAKRIKEDLPFNGARQNPVTVLLEKRGDSAVLVLDKALLDAIGVAPGTLVHISVQNGTLTVSPVSEGFGAEKVAGLLQELRPAYKEMLENLAK